MNKKIFTTILIILLVFISSVVYAGETGDIGSYHIITEYNWSDYSDRSAKYWSEFYKRVSDSSKKSIYQDEYELLALATLHHSEIADVLLAAGYNCTQYVWEDVYGKYIGGNNKVNTYIGIDEEILNAIGENKEDNEENNGKEGIANEIKKDPMKWAHFVAGIYERAATAYGEGKKETFTDYEISEMKRLYTQYQISPLSFPVLTKVQEEEIVNRYSKITLGFSFDTYIPYTYQYMNITMSGEHVGEKEPVKEHTLGDIIANANNFLSKGEGTESPISDSDLKAMSNTLYNILFISGIIIAFVVGGILGIKFMISGLEEKAEVKQMLMPYVIGCVILFGAFTIWKIVLIILQ